MRNRIIKYLSIIFIFFSMGGIIAFISTQRVTSDLKVLINLHRVETFRQDLIINIKTVQNNLFTIGTTFGPELDIIVENVLSLDKAVNRCLECHHSSEVTGKLDRLRTLVEKYKDALSAFITTTANPERIHRLKEVAAEIGNLLLQDAEEMTYFAHQKLQYKTEKAIEKVNKIRELLILVLFITMIFGFFTAMALTRDIVRPIEKLRIAAEKVASGELGYSVDISDPPEFAHLGESFNKMSRSLKEQQEKTLEYVSKLRELHRITLSMHLVTEKKNIINEFVKGVVDVIDADGVLLFLYNPDHDLFSLEQFITKKSYLKRKEIKYSGEIIRKIYQGCGKKATMLYKNEEALRAFSEDNFEAENLYVLWIKHKNKLSGFLLIINVKGTITGEDTRILSIIANNFAVAIENTLLYEDIKLQMKNLKETQDQLIQAAKLAAIGELAATVAHELNNPLTTILGYTELIKEEEISETIKKDLDIIEAESLRARDIVRQLLEFSRKRPLQLTELDINETLQEVIKFLSPNIKKSSIKLLTEFSPLPNTLADKDQIKQVFLNLINNAVQAMPEGGVLTIKTGLQDSNIFIEVSDTGIGIPEDILPRIFEPFFTTKKEKGTGLGLSISYRIIESHGGKIYVKSQKGKGTTFKVLLPIKKHV